jgi:hypothetical protein
MGEIQEVKILLIVSVLIQFVFIVFVLTQFVLN